MARRTLLPLVALVVAAGCVFENPVFDDASSASGSGSTTSASATATTSGGSTSTSASTLATSASTSTSTDTSGTGGVSLSSGDAGATTSATGDPTTSTTSTTGDLCPAVTAIASVFTDDPDCASCLETTCCGEFTACAGPCQGALECAFNEQCVTKWALCPGFDESEMLLRAANQCMNTDCFDACNLGPCAAEQAACRAKPACKAIQACVYPCNQRCMPGDGPCQLACATMCKDLYPAGAAEYDAIWMCIGAQCG